MRHSLYRFLGLVLLSMTLCFGVLSYPANAVTFQYVPVTNALGQTAYEIQPKFTRTDNTTIKEECQKLGCDPSKLSSDEKMAIIKRRVEAVGRISWDDYINKQRELFAEKNRLALGSKLADGLASLANFFGAVADNPLSRGVARTVYGQDTVDELQETRATLQGGSKFANIMNDYMTDDGCWYCGVFADMFDAVNALATTIYSNMAREFLKLMCIGILFFILFKVGKMAISLQEVDLMQFLNELLGPLFRASFACVLLGVAVGAGDTVFHMITNPVIEVSMNMGQEIMKVSMTDSLIMNSGLSEYVPANSISHHINVAAAKLGSVTDNGGNQVMDSAVKEAMVAWMKSVSTSYMVGLAMGSTFISIGGENILSITNNGFAMFLSGIILFLIFGFSYLTFPFRLVDAFVQWAFVLTLMPLWIVLWVFPVTRGYTKKAWEMFLGASVQFVVMAVMIALAVQLINHIVPDQLTAWRLPPIGRSEFYNLLVRGLNDRALRYVGIGDGLIMNAIAFGAMAISLMGAAPAIAGAIAGGATNTDVGRNMMSFSAGVAKGTVVKPAAWVGAKVGAPALGWAFNKAKAAYKGNFGGGSRSGNSDNGDTGGGNSGNSGNGSGQNSSGTPVRGPRGERGATGQRGERGEASPERTSTPSATDTRQGVGSATATRSNAADTTPAPQTTNTTTGTSGTSGVAPNASGRTAQSQAATGTSGAATRADGQQQGKDATSPLAKAEANGLSDLTPAQRKSVQALAKKKDSGNYFSELSEDVAFVEQSQNLDDKAYNEAMKNHVWKTDSKKMGAYAHDVRTISRSPGLVTNASRTLLRESIEAQDTRYGETSDLQDKIIKDVSYAAEHDNRDNHVFSQALAGLAGEIKKTQNTKASETKRG